MSHVDDGALHAYLDGALDEYPAAEAARIRAHLDVCGECAARLEVERRVRSDAHALLGLASPVVDVPSLEELRAYVHRTAQQRRGISRIQRLGWAASVVVALGAGWMLRDGQLQSRALDIGADLAPRSGVTAADATVETDAVSDPAASPTVALESNESLASVRERLESSEGFLDEATPMVEALGRRASPAEEEVVDVDLDKAREDAGAAEPFAEAVDRLDQRQARVVSAGGGASVPADMVATILADTVMPAPEPTVAGAGAVAVLTGRSEAQAAVPASADSSPSAGQEARRRQVREPTTLPGVVTNASRVDPTPARSNAEADAPRSLVLEAEAADDEPDVEPLLSVPGYEVVDVTNLGEGSTAWGARVRQRTEDGRRFEVFHLEAGIDPSILPPLDAGVGEVSTETPFGWVLIRGTMDDEQLGELLLRLFPEAP